MPGASWVKGWTRGRVTAVVVIVTSSVAALYVLKRIPWWSRDQPKSETAKLNNEDIPTTDANHDEGMGTEIATAATTEQSTDSSPKLQNGNTAQLPLPASETVIDLTKPAEIEQWEFEFEKAMGGRLFGRKSKNIKATMKETGTRIVVLGTNPDHPTQVLRITGTVANIQLAVAAIETQFRTEELHRITPGGPRVYQPRLHAHKNNDVIVTHIASDGRVYVQIATTSQMIVQRGLDTALADGWKKKTKENGHLSTPPKPDTYVALSDNGNWYRARVEHHDDGEKYCTVTRVDYGSTVEARWRDLRRIKDELMYVPFQAIECYLAHVQPPAGNSYFSLTACAMLEQWTSGAMVTAYVTNRRHNLPCIELCAKGQNDTVLLLNRELVDCGLARWVESFNTDGI